jgi:hypothetical protein
MFWILEFWVVGLGLHGRLGKLLTSMKLKPRCCCKGERICRVDSRASYSWVNGPCTSASGYQEWTAALLPHLLHWNSEFETAFSLYTFFYVGYNVNDSSPLLRQFILEVLFLVAIVVIMYSQP